MLNRDHHFGAALRAWAEARTGVDLRGPLETAGMDPTWILRITTEDLDTEVHVFTDPRAEFAAFRPAAADAGMQVAYRDPITEEQLIEMVTDLDAAAHGAALPAWLRPA